MKKFVHVFIALEPYELKGVEYRRHRLAAFLSVQKSTSKIIWICASNQERITRIRVERISKNIFQFVVPFLTPVPFKYLIRIFHKNIAEKIVYSLKDLKEKYVLLLWYTSPVFSGLANQKYWGKIIYDCSDNWGYPWMTFDDGFSESIKLIIGRFIMLFWKSSENHIIKNSTLVFTTSKYLKKKCTARTNAPIYLVENGVDFDNFNNYPSGKELFSIKSPRLGYVGGIKKKIDLALLHKLAIEKRNWNFILIGPDYNSNFLKKLLRDTKNIHWFKSVNPQEIPRYLKQLDLGLLPYREIEYNKGVFPLKFFEYLSCGLPVVGCGLPSTKSYEKDGVYIHTKAHSEDFIDACTKALNWTNFKKERIKIAEKAKWIEKLKFITETALKKV